MLSLWQRWSSRVRKVEHLPGWPELAGPDWETQIMNWPPGERHHAKQGRSIGRYKLSETHHAFAIFLKRQHESPWWLGLLARLLPGRIWGAGLREMRNLRLAEQLGVPAPRAWAAGERIGPHRHVESFLAVEELDGMLALHEAIPLAAKNLPRAVFQAWKAGLAGELARLTRLLHDNSYFHQDLYLCHFFISETDTAEAPKSWQGRVVMIDFHRLARRPLGGLWWRIKDLAQLLYSSNVTGLTVRDRLSFWRAYRRGDSRWLRALVGWKARRYQRHNVKRIRASLNNT